MAECGREQDWDAEMLAGSVCTFTHFRGNRVVGLCDNCVRLCSSMSAKFSPFLFRWHQSDGTTHWGIHAAKQLWQWIIIVLVLGRRRGGEKEREEGRKEKEIKEGNGEGYCPRFGEG